MNFSIEKILKNLKQLYSIAVFYKSKDTYTPPHIEELKVSKSEMLISFSGGASISDFDEVNDPVFYN